MLFLEFLQTEKDLARVQCSQHKGKADHQQWPCHCGNHSGQRLNEEEETSVVRQKCPPNSDRVALYLPSSWFIDVL